MVYGKRRWSGLPVDKMAQTTVEDIRRQRYLGKEAGSACESHLSREAITMKISRPFHTEVVDGKKYLGSLEARSGMTVTADSWDTFWNAKIGSGCSSNVSLASPSKSAHGLRKQEVAGLVGREQHSVHAKLAIARVISKKAKSNLASALSAHGVKPSPALHSVAKICAGYRVKTAAEDRASLPTTIESFAEPNRDAFAARDARRTNRILREHAKFADFVPDTFLSVLPSSTRLRSLNWGSPDVG
uniref:Uncharacterized protein n=1 Tax=Compsopogon caeruleus TaxID=31354 RepID=A0A7S1TGW5_9RHOD|mmetsp:Transcript_6654/g.13513  ORF Transcript_6654/g.13513 Transcript_6654/m.13513 type:complete len:244 (+) Transcript_6654:130-861(+)|eukprot:CAMPEP_0184687786 /NCGR_PEP_ID=MMETSP0312-20130426/27548_1 /TAXON_ID=31354 /ORGANISM="Compsopogon coeruleus, Strain SAG 36.94" /LENGTH=243 /DNA_ID=CAMNT_0027144275 /DNA_START=36 /DNA_END=767 /DNA_ORIENTATION=+